MNATPKQPDSRLEVWMKAMTDCVRATNEELKLSAVLAIVARNACHLIGLRQCAIYVFDRESGQFHIGGSHGLTEQYVRTANARPIEISEATARSGPPTARAVLTRLPVVVHDAFGEPGLERFLPSMRAEGLQMMVAAPLQVADELPFGTVTGYCTQRNFDEADMQQLMLLSDHAAAAIVAARRRDSESSAISALGESNRALSSQQSALAQMRDLQHDLTQLVLQDAGLPHILNRLADELHADIYLDTEGGKPVASSAYSADASEVADRSLVVHSASVGSVESALDIGRTIHFEHEGGNTTLVPVPSVDRPRIRMWVRSTSDDKFDEHAIRAMEECALLIAIDRSRLQIRAHVEARIVNDLITDLLSPASMIRPETFEARAAALGHDPTSNYTPIVVVLTGDHNRPQSNFDAADLAHSLTEIFQWMRPRPIFGTFGEAAIALVPARSGSDAVDVVLKQATRNDRDQFRWVVGSAAHSLIDVRSALDVAMRAAKLMTADSATVVHVAHFGVPGLLLEAGTSDRMLAFADQLLGPIQREDALKEGDLMNTLAEWFRCDMSARETARRLFVHPNTVSYRLRRIGDLAGLRLNNSSDLMSIRLALDILTVRGSTR